MKHWKTSLGGALFIAGAGFHALHVPALQAAGAILQSLAVGWLGYHAADKPVE